MPCRDTVLLKKKMQTHPRYKLIFLSFSHGNKDITPNIEERKADVFFITISIVIPAVQLLTQNINNCRGVFETQLNIYDGTFLKKISIVAI